MKDIPFVFTILFMLVGPIKLIPFFAGLMRSAEAEYKRAVALRATLIAAVLCAFVALAGGNLLDKYRISVDAVRISGGLVLMISALLTIFQKNSSPNPSSSMPTAMQLAVSPVAVPGIVPPAGVAAILIMMLLAPQYPGMGKAVAICLTMIMALNFLVMRFIDRIVKTPGLSIVLTVLGSVLVFVQVALAVQMILTALGSLGFLHG